MSQLLFSLKPQITKARNLTYFGQYSHSIQQFTKILALLEREQQNIQRNSKSGDRILLQYWQNLIKELQYQRELAENMAYIVAGDFGKVQQNMNKNKNYMKEDTDTRLTNISKKLSSQKKVNAVNKCKIKDELNEDDEQYWNALEIQKQKQAKKQEKEKLQRQIQFERRQKQVWPQRKPTIPSYKRPQSQSKQTAQYQNSSKLSHQERNTSMKANPQTKSKSKLIKPLNSTQQNQQNQRKSYLKHCYPDGNGPDSNLIISLEQQVIDTKLNITFDSIADLQNAKDLLQEAILLPLHMPKLFTGIRRPWKGVLLFGPPGTGKTLLAKAVASTCKTTFFNVTASSLASKWKGQSQKLVRILFEMAAYYAPTTIFIDEVDALTTRRGQKQDDSSLKMKTELMARIDGASNTGKNIVIIGATNRPWDLDQAIIRRFEKRIYIPLPTQTGRKQLLQINLKNQQISTELNLNNIVQKTEGYSGADIANLVREAAYIPMRKKLKKQAKEGRLMKKLGNQQWMKQFQKQINVPITMNDFKEALRNVKTSVGKTDMVRYRDWMREFGEQGNNNNSNSSEEQEEQCEIEERQAELA